jgi:RimJ/RimL family protein N-acetyltransferase
MIGEKKYWGKGYGQEACKSLLKYAFNNLNLNKVILGVYENHKPAIRAYQKIGFKIEGRIENLLNFEGKYVNKIIMGISRQKFLIFDE